MQLLPSPVKLESLGRIRSVIWVNFFCTRAVVSYLGIGILFQSRSVIWVTFQLLGIGFLGEKKRLVSDENMVYEWHP